MQLVNAPVYGHSKFHDGFRCYLVTEIEGKKAQVIETATLVAGEIDANCLRRAKEYDLQPLKLRRSLLDRLENRKRWGLEVSEKQVAAALHKLGAGERTVAKIMETAPMPEIVEKRTVKKEREIKNKEMNEALIEQKQSAILVERIKAEQDAERLAKAAKVRQETGFAGGSKRLIIADMLCRPEGATSDEMASATGWKKVSAATFAKIKDRVTIVRKEKTENGTRYFGQRVAKQD